MYAPLLSPHPLPTLVQEDVVLDGLPGGALDELQLGDVRLGQPTAVSFELVNRSEGKQFRCVASKAGLGCS